MMHDLFSSTVQSRIEKCGIIATVTVQDVSKAVPLARTLLAGGIDVIELTLRTPSALECVRAVADEVPEILIGVGTLIRPYQVKAVIEAGAHFGVAPGMNRTIVQTCLDQGFPFAPGVATPSEIEAALEFDCRVLKFFPAEPLGGLEYLKSMQAPYSYLGLGFVPLGGLNAQNAARWLQAPFVPAIGGSWIAPAGLIDAGDWQTIEANAREAVQCKS